MSLFPIFKVNKMSDKNVTDTIYVFYGSLEIEDPNDLFDDDPTNKFFTNIFNKYELNYIKDKKVEVIFIIWSNMDKIEKLKELKSLFESSIISKEEFEQLKNEIINQNISITCI